MTPLKLLIEIFNDGMCCDEIVVAKKLVVIPL
jgi:hypothetical protein